MYCSISVMFSQSEFEAIIVYRFRYEACMVLATTSFWMDNHKFSCRPRTYLKVGTD